MPLNSRSVPPAQTKLLRSGMAMVLRQGAHRAHDLIEQSEPEGL